MNSLRFAFEKLTRFIQFCQISPNPSLLKRGTGSDDIFKIEVLPNNLHFSNKCLILFKLIPLFSKEGLGEIWQKLKRSSILIIQAATFSLFFANPLSAGEPQHSLATLDWTVAETLIALAEQPKAVGDAKNYKVWVSEPKLPENTLDLGIRLQPNPEQLWQLSTQLEAQPLLFINSSFYASATPMLEKFGKVHLVDFYKEGEAWQNVVDATKQIADIIEKPEQADRLLNKYWQKIAEIRPLVKPFSDRPVICPPKVGQVIHVNIELGIVPGSILLSRV